MHLGIILLILIIVGCFGPVAVLRAAAGFGCLITLFIALVIVVLWFTTVSKSGTAETLKRKLPSSKSTVEVVRPAPSPSLSPSLSPSPSLSTVSNSISPLGTMSNPYIIHTDGEHDALPLNSYFRDERPFGHAMLKQKIIPSSTTDQTGPEVRRAALVTVRRAELVRHQ